jgi:hypothetical protein
MKQVYLSKRFDEAAIVATFCKIAFDSDPTLSKADFQVLAALRRSSPQWDLSIEETSNRIALYSDEQIRGLLSNVKGILHEMEFVRLENEDGDSVIASLYADTNHKSVDVQMFDADSDNYWSVQLKATDDIGYVNSWIDSNPDTEIFVTQELSERMDLPSSGINNEDLSIRVEGFVDRLIELQDSPDSPIWDYMPPLIVASSGIIVFEIWRRYKRGEISFDQFQWLTLKTLGMKTGKYALMFTALAVPGLNVIAGAYMLGSLVLSITEHFDRAPKFMPFSFLGTKS